LETIYVLQSSLSTNQLPFFVPPSVLFEQHAVTGKVRDTHRIRVANVAEQKSEKDRIKVVISKKSHINRKESQRAPKKSNTREIYNTF